jgi:hypothetical protein
VMMTSKGRGHAVEFNLREVEHNSNYTKCLVCAARDGKAVANK